MLKIIVQCVIGLHCKWSVKITVKFCTSVTAVYIRRRSIVFVFPVRCKAPEDYVTIYQVKGNLVTCSIQ